MRRLITFTCTLMTLCWLCGSLPTVASAQEATLQEVVATLEQGYTGLKDMQASFSQTTTLPGLPKPQKGQGELYLRRPEQGAAQFRFDYAKPKQSIVSNGKQVWFYQPENRQVIVTSMETMLKSGGSLAMSYLTGLGNVSRDFTVAFAKPARDRQNNYIIDLTPRKPSPALAKLRLAISNEAVENCGQPVPPLSASPSSSPLSWMPTAPRPGSITARCAPTPASPPHGFLSSLRKAQK